MARSMGILPRRDKKPHGAPILLHMAACYGRPAQDLIVPAPTHVLGPRHAQFANSAAGGVLNGPNLNMLGLRQPEIYGTATLDDVESLCAETAERLGLAIDFRQTNGEGELISWVQECRGRAAGHRDQPGRLHRTPRWRCWMRCWRWSCR